jgi:putative redox protein
MSLEATINWNNNMSFTAHSGGHQLKIDTTSEHGGDNTGPTPKQLILHAMMGCTAMDVVSMLQKMRQEIKNFNMSIKAEKNQHYPIHFKSAHLIYSLEGSIAPEKAIKSVESSLSKYCGVNYMLSKVVKVTYEIILNKIKIHEGISQFIEPMPD